MSFNHERFIEDYQILDGIPDNRFNLTRVFDSFGPLNSSIPQEMKDTGQISCGSMACGIGWLVMHPKNYSRALAYNADANYRQVAMDWYEISDREALNVFGTYPSPLDPKKFRNDKERLLGRMRNFLKLKENQ